MIMLVGAKRLLRCATTPPGGQPGDPFHPPTPSNDDSGGQQREECFVGELCGGGGDNNIGTVCQAVAQECVAPTPPPTTGSQPSRLLPMVLTATPISQRGARSTTTSRPPVSSPPLIPPDGSVDVQVRQQPAKGETSVTFATAVAANVDGDRVGVYALEPWFLRVNGTVETGAGFSERLPHGGTVARNGDSVTCRWPDGSELVITLFNNFAFSNFANLSYSFTPAPGTVSNLTGLLGTGNIYTQLVDSDGTTLLLSDPKFEKKLYSQFANSWRISQAESLFEYRPGESTATFTNLKSRTRTTRSHPCRRQLGPKQKQFAPPSASAQSRCSTTAYSTLVSPVTLGWPRPRHRSRRPASRRRRYSRWPGRAARSASPRPLTSASLAIPALSCTGSPARAARGAWPSARTWGTTSAPMARSRSPTRGPAGRPPPPLPRRHRRLTGPTLSGRCRVGRPGHVPPSATTRAAGHLATGRDRGGLGLAAGGQRGAAGRRHLYGGGAERRVVHQLGDVPGRRPVPGGHHLRACRGGP